MNWDLVVGISSLLVPTIALYISVKIKELVEIQKTMALLALHAPACADPNDWARVIHYLAQRDLLRAWDQTDEAYLLKLLERLGIKIDTNQKRFADAILSD